jgi:hypothetical protein
MKKSYESGLATHIGPESCGAAREGGVEALTGESAGRVYSRERHSLRDADPVGERGRHHLAHRYREVYQSPACPDPWRGLWVTMISTPTGAALTDRTKSTPTSANTQVA